MLCLDPGETTGWAIFKQGALFECGQEPTPEPTDMATFLHEFIDMDSFERIVYEEYRVRGNKYNEHVGSEVVTIQHIGAIKVVASGFGRELTKQTASQVKGFATDAKLRMWDLYQSGQRHANDALRHGVYFHLFSYGKKDPRHRS